MIPLLLCNSCGDEGCTESRNSYTVATIRQDTVNSATAIRMLSVFGIGQKNDSAMVEATNSLQSVSLILNPDTSFTKMEFVFTLDLDTVIDTLSFYYRNEAYFISIDCGCSVHNYIDSVLHTNHLIQQVEIINPEITNEKKTNIAIHY